MQPDNQTSGSGRFYIFMSYPSDFQENYFRYKHNKKILEEIYGVQERQIRKYAVLLEKDLNKIGKKISYGKKNGAFYPDFIKDIKEDEKEEREPKTTNQDIKQALELLSASGYAVDLKKQTDRSVIKTDTGEYKTKILKMGFVSDTHLCAKSQQLTHLNSFYDLCVDMEIPYIFNSGDVGNGEEVYPGQIYENFVHGFSEQRHYIIDNYPKRQGITTYMISGNHDLKIKSKAGADVIPDVCEARDDLVYCGAYAGQVEVDKVRIRMQHGRGSASYAASYKLQKYLEQLSSEDKCHIYELGHYHRFLSLPKYRNIFAIMPGGFQGQTEFLTALGIRAEIGGVIIIATVNYLDNGGINFEKFRYEHIPFYRPIDNDY